jgi:hypothetical protein
MVVSSLSNMWQFGQRPAARMSLTDADLAAADPAAQLPPGDYPRNCLKALGGIGLGPRFAYLLSDLPMRLRRRNGNELRFAAKK